MSKRKKPRYQVMEGKGDPCPRCSEPTQIREHKELTSRHLVRQPFYYRRWFYCANPHCVVTLYMTEEFKVWNNRTVAEEHQRRRAIQLQLTPPA